MQELVSSASKMFIYFVTQTCLGELEVSSSRLKALLFLVSKIVTYSTLTWTLMLRLESIFSLTSSHWTDTRNQCNVHLIRAELQVKVNFTYNCISFITTWRKERCPKCCRQFRKILLEKETQRIKISYCILGQKKNEWIDLSENRKKHYKNIVMLFSHTFILLVLLIATNCTVS